MSVLTFKLHQTVSSDCMLHQNVSADI